MSRAAAIESAGVLLKAAGVSVAEFAASQGASAEVRRLLPTNKAAEYLGMNRKAVLALGLPTILNGQKIMFDLADINAWIEANKHEAGQ